jgi:hypothetical protein
VVPARPSTERRAERRAECPDLRAHCLDRNPAEASAQRWTAGLDGTLRIDGKCADVYRDATTNGAKVDLYTCNGGANQQWTARPGGEIVSLQSGRCLDDPGFSTVNGTQLDIWACNGGANQRWKLP